MSESDYSQIELTLINKDLETTTEFAGKLLGQAVQIYDDNKHLPQELIRIYKREDGKFLSYMEYSDRRDGVWLSKMCVTDELHLADIKRGLTRNNFYCRKFRHRNRSLEDSRNCGLSRGGKS